MKPPPWGMPTTLYGYANLRSISDIPSKGYGPFTAQGPGNIALYWNGDNWSGVYDLCSCDSNGVAQSLFPNDFPNVKRLLVGMNCRPQGDYLACGVKVAEVRPFGSSGDVLNASDMLYCNELYQVANYYNPPNCTQQFGTDCIPTLFINAAQEPCMPVITPWCHLCPAPNYGDSLILIERATNDCLNVGALFSNTTNFMWLATIQAGPGQLFEVWEGFIAAGFQIKPAGYTLYLTSLGVNW